MRRTLHAAPVVAGLALIFGLPSALAAPAPQAAARPPELSRLTRHDAVSLRLPPGSPDALLVNVEAGGRTLPLELHRYSLRSDSFQVLVDDGSGELQPVEAPPVRTYRGGVSGTPGSRVTASIVDGKLWATVRLPGEPALFIEPVVSLEPGLAGDGRHVAYRSADVRPGEGTCGVIDDVHPLVLALEPGEGGAEDLAEAPADPLEGAGDGAAPQGAAEDEGGIAGSTALSIVKIAFDADFEFFQKNFSSAASTVSDIENIFNDVDQLYIDATNITYEITTIVVRSAPDDPYTAADAEGLLCEFRNTWNSSPESDIDRSVAHLFTGRNLTGTTIGLAFTGVVCGEIGNACDSIGRVDYGIVESKFLGATLKERGALSAHELGHNWSCPHCDDQDPCHIMCSSMDQCDGVNGLNDFFIEPASAGQITDYKNAVSCDKVVGDPFPVPFIDLFPSGSVSLSKWLYNDGAQISSGGTAEPSGTTALNLDSTGADPYDDNQVRSNFILLAGATGGASVSYWTQHKGVENGESLMVDYLNDDAHWVNLNTIVSDGVDEVVFTQWEHVIPSSELSDRFRLRIRVDGSDSTDDWYLDDVTIDEILPPVNDECAGAVALSTGVNAWTTLAATNSSGAPAPCATITKDVWFTYAYPGTCGGTVTITLCGQSPANTGDTVLAAYTGTCASLTQVACNNNGPCGGPSEISFAAAPGTTYRIRLGMFSTNAATSGVLSVAFTQPDSDGDGTPNCTDGCPNDPNKTAPGACGCGSVDTDSDGDGTPNCVDGCPNDPNKTAPGACGCGSVDTDSDGDGTPNCTDGCPNDPNKVSPGACGCGTPDSDSDGDGVANCLDGCPSDPAKFAPGTCGCGVSDADSDGDGTPDCSDGCPSDPTKTAPGTCGCGVSDADLDDDGTPDCTDGCPNDPAKVAPGGCGCGVSDADSDGDGAADCNDGCPADPAKISAGQCGCGVPDLDSDGDGVADCNDLCPGFDDNVDENENGIPDGCETAGCVGDLDGSGSVDGADLGLLLGAWGTADDVADLDGSGEVDGADLGLLLGAWGGCP